MVVDMFFLKFKPILFLLVVFFCNPVLSANISGDIRGVTFFYLDGEPQDFPWVLDNQYNPSVRLRIDNLLSEYRSAGVNWIRILVSADHFYPKSMIYPNPSNSIIKKVNDFIAITRSGNNRGKFNIEIVLIPGTANGFFTDTMPYTIDKAWFETWIRNLNYSNIGMVVFGGDLSPCYLSGCEGDVSAQPIPRNHGKWIKEIWSWKQQKYPNLNATYEVIAVQGGTNNDPNLIKKLSNWINANTPSVPYISVSIYLNLPSGSSWQSYASATSAILDAYHSVSSKPLWIDEFGKSHGTHWNLQDQNNAYSGFLGSSVCLRMNGYPKFAWVAGNDFPYNNINWYGLVTDFYGSTPVMSSTWSILSLYYRLSSCP